MGVDGGEVEGIHRFDEILGNLFAGESVDGDAL